MAQQVEENHLLIVYLLTCFSFSQVYVNTTERIDLQKTYKLGVESYKVFSAKPLKLISSIPKKSSAFCMKTSCFMNK